MYDVPVTRIHDIAQAEAAPGRVNLTTLIVDGEERPRTCMKKARRRYVGEKLI